MFLRFQAVDKIDSVKQSELSLNALQDKAT